MLVLVRKDINSIIFLYSIKFQENIDIKKKNGVGLSPILY